jgi:transposase
MQEPVEIQVEEHIEIVERVAAIDVAKATGMICTRVPHDTKPGGRVTKVWEVKATTRAILELADHLVCQSIQRVVLESTSDYWRSFYYVLEARGLRVWLVNASQVKHAPGRPKSDKIDAVWLAKLNERNMVSPSFVPPAQIRRLRDWTRARYDLVEDRTRVKLRIEKLLEDALVKLSTVATDMFGVSGRAMMEALIGGQPNPRALADMAKGRMRLKHAALAEALDGRFTDHHASLLRLLLDQFDHLNTAIESVTVRIDELITALPAAAAPDQPPAAPGIDQTAHQTAHLSAVERLCEIPGVGPDIARTIIAELGLDMTVFGTAQRLCAWARVAPTTKQSGRRQARGKTGKGNPYIKSSLGQAATGAAKTQTFLGERYRRLIKRMPKGKARTAIARSILMIIFALLADPTTRYHDLGPDFYARHLDTRRRTDQLVRQLQALGHTVTLEPAA